MGVKSLGVPPWAANVRSPGRAKVAKAPPPGQTNNQQYVCRFGRTKCQIGLRNKMPFKMPPGTLKSFQLFLHPLSSNHHLRYSPKGAFNSIFHIPFSIVKYEICVYCLTIEITKWFSSRQFDLYNYSSSGIDRIWKGQR